MTARTSAREGTFEAELGAEAFKLGRLKPKSVGLDSDADFVASDFDSDSDADYGATPPPAKKRGKSKSGASKPGASKRRKKDNPVVFDLEAVYPRAAKVRETVLERARAHGHTVREVDGEHVIVHRACPLSTSAVESVVRAVRDDTVPAPETR
jgi:hypothetical protein